MPHVGAMTLMGAAGLFAIFLGDLLAGYYLSAFGGSKNLSALGFSTTILFFHTAISVGLSVAVGSHVSRIQGVKARDEVQDEITVLVLGAGVVSLGFTTVTYALLPYILAFLGATGSIAALSAEYLHVALVSRPFLTLGICLVAALRARGDGRRAMFATLAGALASIVLDPLFIVVLEAGLPGAGTSNTMARMLFALVAFLAFRRMGGFRVPAHECVRDGLVALSRLGPPAALTQFAAAFGGAMILKAAASFGHEAVAAWAVIERVSAVAFVVPLALSGSVGPILGQNLGARLHERVRETLSISISVVAGYVIPLWLVLALAGESLAHLFSLRGVGVDMVVFFFTWLSARYFFLGLLAVATASCSYAGVPVYGTWIGWGHATLGTVPFVWLGAQWSGAPGLLAGATLGTAVSSVAALAWSTRVLKGRECKACSSC